MSRQVMCHVVAGYPSPEECLELLLGMQTVGVAAIEVQIPFSDPIADGETIMQANDVALNHDMTVARNLELIKTARSRRLKTDIYIMSYIQKVSHYGFEKFCRQAAEYSVKGLIIPDLPYDSPEFSQLQQMAATHQLMIIPVLSPDMSKARLQAILKLEPGAIYVTSTHGITGAQYAPAGHLKQLVETIRQQSAAEVMIGFGIASIQDVEDALKIGDVAVVGSAVIKKLQTDGLESALELIESLVNSQ